MYKLPGGRIIIIIVTNVNVKVLNSFPQYFSAGHAGEIAEKGKQVLNITFGAISILLSGNIVWVPDNFSQRLNFCLS